MTAEQLGDRSHRELKVFISHIIRGGFLCVRKTVGRLFKQIRQVFTQVEMGEHGRWASDHPKGL